MKRLYIIGLLSLFFSVNLDAKKNDIENNDIENNKIENNNIINKIKALESHARWAESAHPTPDRTSKIMVPLAIKYNSPIFLNSNTIVENEGANPTQNESSIAINPKNPLNLIASAVDYRQNSEAKVYVSHDGGKTWENIFLGRPHDSWRSSNDPSVAYDKDGVGYLVYGAFENSNAAVRGNGVYMARSFDEGRTWESNMVVIEHTDGITLDSPFEDKYYINIDNSERSLSYFKNLYIPWKRVTARDSATQIVLTKSSDKGETWSEPIPVSPRLSGTSEDTTYGQSFPLVATGANGEVYLVWNNGIEHAVGFAASFDGGSSFGDPKLIHYYDIFGETTDIARDGQLGPIWRHTLKGMTRAEAYPVIDVDISGGEHDGTIYLTWAAGNPPDIFFSSSTDHGDTWSDPVVIHEDPTNDQFFQWLAVDQTNGDIAIMYLDSRSDPDNYLVECWVSYSSDGGVTWVDRRVSDYAFDFTLNPFGRVFSGDYSGVAFDDGYIYPSWVDMRYSEENISDNDVFTAIINTKAPLPVEEFKAIIDPLQPKKAILNWKVVAESSFGRQLNNDDFSLLLFRNNELIAELEPSVTEYIEEDLLPFEKYEYKICAYSDKDTSNFRFLNVYPGGARQPMSPELVSYIPISSGLKINAKIPTKRADGVTPLANVDELICYIDGSEYTRFDIGVLDTGKTIEFDISYAERGYIRMQLSLVDEFAGTEIQAQESDRSIESIVFAGETYGTHEDNFESDLAGYYLSTDGFGLTDNFAYSGIYSLTESPNGDYDKSENDTLFIHPITPQSDRYALEFYHAAIVKLRDSAIVEISEDYGKTWSLLASYDIKNYSVWEDGELNENDWKYEKIEFNVNSDFIVRLRFFSNLLAQEDGWYVDDIKIIPAPVKVEDNIASKIKIYPNPAASFVNIKADEGIALDKLNIYNLHGSNVLSITEMEIREINNAQIDLNTLSPGIYYIEIHSGNKRYLDKLIKID